MNFNIRMGIPEMQELWLDLQEKYRSGNIKKKEEQLYKKWGKALKLLSADPGYPSLQTHMQISALEVWHVNNEENNSQMCSLESGSADENIETMKAYMCKQRGMHLGSKISREEITKKVNQSKYEKYCYITNRLRRKQFPLDLF